MTLTNDPHRNCAVHFAGTPLNQAHLVVLAAHGRYGVSDDVLKLAEQVNVPDVAWIAPQAEGRSWWGETFLAPLAMNEPGLSSALNRFATITDDLAQSGFGPEQIVLVGFSQGACLILEHAARNPKPWRGIVAMSGGLLGTSERNESPSESFNGHVPKHFDYRSNLTGLPIHLGCHTDDPVIPISRVRKSKTVLEDIGATVTLCEEQGRMHGIISDDIAAIKNLLERSE
ncbi:MAG: hypothetical protein ABJ251_01195 [Paracoccaceae bacterium]